MTWLVEQPSGVTGLLVEFAAVFVAGCLGGSVTAGTVQARRDKPLKIRKKDDRQLGVDVLISRNSDSESIRIGRTEESDSSGQEQKQEHYPLSLLAYKDPACDTIYAGPLGNILLGGLAAVVYWALYGPVSGLYLLGNSQAGPYLTLGQLAGSILLGMGGPAYLLAEADKRCTERKVPKSNNAPCS